MKAKLLLFIFFPLFLLMACQKEEVIENLTHRTVLFYLAGDNNLTYPMSKNIEMIKEGMHTANITNGNILVYEAFRGQAPHLYQLKLEKGVISQIEIETYEPNQSSASTETLSLVLNKVHSRFPAESYGLVLSSHGTGWLPSDLNNHLRSFGQDSHKKQMDINDLSKALSKHHFDFVLFDACYMACTEVAYALKGCTDYVIGSPNEILIDGFPYKNIIGHLFEKDIDMVAIASAFYSYYENNSGSVSVVKTSELDELAASCREILHKKTESELFAVPVKELQVMELLKSRYHALYDFDDYISRLATPEQYQTFKQRLEKAIIYKACTPTLYFDKRGTIAINKFCGLSIYVPQAELASLNEWYKRLDWYQAVYE